MPSNPRSFKFLAATTAPAPLVGTDLEGAIAACTLATQTTVSGVVVAGQSVLVADSSMFVAGDLVNIFPANNSGTNAEYQVPVTAVPDGTHIVILNFNPHADTDFVQLWWPCAQVRVQESKATPPAGSLFLGASLALTNAGVAAFEDLSVDFTFLSPIRPGNSDNLCNYFVAGANGGELYLPSAWQV